MDGIHDLGGMDGFGAVVVEPEEPVFHAPWEGRVFAMAGLVIGRGVTNPDGFRHAIERLPPLVYLTAGYYGRWLAALEDVLARPLVTQPHLRGALREIADTPRFAVGHTVVARNLHPRAHTRLPRYVRGRRGTVTRIHPAWVFPDTNAHGLGENPQYVYSVGFPARELWGPDGDAAVTVHVDLFESYLDAAT